VEQELARIQEQAKTFPHAYQELAAIRYYLHVALLHGERLWRSQHMGITEVGKSMGWTQNPPVLSTLGVQLPLPAPATNPARAAGFQGFDTFRSEQAGSSRNRLVTAL
jgi:hypothetical protein